MIGEMGSFMFNFLYKKVKILNGDYLMILKWELYFYCTNNFY